MAQRSHARLMGVNTAFHSRQYGDQGSMYMVPADTAGVHFEPLEPESDPVEASFRANIFSGLADCEWQRVDDTAGDAAQQLAAATEHADLVILAQADPDNDSWQQKKLLHEFADNAHCPVLIVPLAGDVDGLGSRTLESLGVVETS